MQHADIDSNSTALNLAGIPFSSVSSSSISFDQYTANPLQNGWSTLGSGVRLSAHRSRLPQPGIWITSVVPCCERHVFMDNLVIGRNRRKFFQHAQPGVTLAAHTLGLAGLGERLWLLLESKRGLRVQVQ